MKKQRAPSKNALQKRLAHWKRELATDEHGFMHLAKSAIKGIEEELQKREDRR